MGKMVVLKPVVWNSNGYLGPIGGTTSSGYAGVHGYGHEEWNGRSDWVWKGWKVFHTQGKGRMFSYADEGNLGIIMTTMRDGQFYAVGAACAIYQNDENDRAAIAKELDLRRNGNALWKLPGIKSLKKNKAAFDAHWEDAYEWVQWRCPQSHFVWFSPSILIIPDDIIPSKPPSPPRQAIIKMHGSYQAVRPDQALAIIAERLPSSHPILAWLSTDDFDDVRDRSVRNAPPPRGKGRKSAGTATDPYTRYLQENEFQITPKHHHLQSAFEAFLKASNATQVVPNMEWVDVRYHDAQFGPVLAEIKPTDPLTIRFAIRAAIGQLLDYHQKQEGNPRLLVVTDCRPSNPDDLALATDNGFGLAWRDGKKFEFRWPSHQNRRDKRGSLINR
ncbi:hypothetical protein [Mesorhizobium sp. M0768]|uniref:hypothetical protein n=1 Tax=unclassified Mesorhizobium TaxID=325217 RepID=UPI0033360E65